MRLARRRCLRGNSRRQVSFIVLTVSLGSLLLALNSVLHYSDTYGHQERHQLLLNFVPLLENNSASRNMTIPSTRGWHGTHFHTDPINTTSLADKTHAILRSSNSVLLAGTPRTNISYFTIGFVTLSRPKGDYFFSTLNSLIEHASVQQSEIVTIVIMLADRNESFNSQRLQEIKNEYPQQLADGFILVISAPNTDYLFQKTDLKRNYNDSLDRVRWRSKQNLDYASLMGFCFKLSTYYIQLEDDVLSVDNYVQLLQDFIQQYSNKNWAVLSVNPYGFIGKIFHNADLLKMVVLLKLFYLEQPCDFIIMSFMTLMTQAKAIHRKQSLFLHQGKYSSLSQNVIRSLDRIPGASPIRVKHHKGDNPNATLTTSMTVWDKHDLIHAYQADGNDYFWAARPKLGDYVSVFFQQTQQLARVVIETGFSEQDQNDIAHNATLKVGKEVTGVVGSNAVCSETYDVGDLTDGRLDVSFNNHTTVAKCITLVLNKAQKEWLVIREIAVFVKQAR